MKQCKMCGSSFKAKELIDGKLRNCQRRKYCFTCSPFGSGNTRKLERPAGRQRERTSGMTPYQKATRKDRKVQLLDMMGGECCICGYDKCKSAMCFHHVDPSVKSFGISDIGLLKKWSLLVDEVKKCVVLCNRCHVEVHAGLHRDKEDEWKNCRSGVGVCTAR